MSDIHDYYKEVDPGPPEGCDGPCSLLQAWCPKCYRWQAHIRVAPHCIECCECGELSQAYDKANDD
jgi:hypothetical protein